MSGYGAGERTRTPDLRITNALLYRLSYTSIFNFLGRLNCHSEPRNKMFTTSAPLNCKNFARSAIRCRISLSSTHDLRITNALLYRLSYTSILNFPADRTTILEQGTKCSPCPCHRIVKILQDLRSAATSPYQVHYECISHLNSTTIIISQPLEFVKGFLKKQHQFSNFNDSKIYNEIFHLQLCKLKVTKNILCISDCIKTPFPRRKWGLKLSDKREKTRKPVR